LGFMSSASRGERRGSTMTLSDISTAARQHAADSACLGVTPRSQLVLAESAGAC
jgi:hypothetical protein